MSIECFVKAQKSQKMDTWHAPFDPDRTATTIAAVVGNVVLLLLTCTLLWTEGPSRGGGNGHLLNLLVLLHPGESLRAAT